MFYKCNVEGPIYNWPKKFMKNLWNCLSNKSVNASVTLECSIVNFAFLFIYNCLETCIITLRIHHLCSFTNLVSRQNSDNVYENDFLFLQNFTNRFCLIQKPNRLSYTLQWKRGVLLRKEDPLPLNFPWSTTQIEKRRSERLVLGLRGRE